MEASEQCRRAQLFQVLYAEWLKQVSVAARLTAGRAVAPGANPSDHAAGHEAMRTFRRRRRRVSREATAFSVCVVFSWLALAPPALHFVGRERRCPGRSCFLWSHFQRLQ